MWVRLERLGTETKAACRQQGALCRTPSSSAAQLVEADRLDAHLCRLAAFSLSSFWLASSCCLNLTISSSSSVPRFR